MLVYYLSSIQKLQKMHLIKNIFFKSFMLKNVVFLDCLFVCLFGVYSQTREFFTHMETSLLRVKGCKFLTYARHSWQLSSEGSLACQNLLQHGPTVYNGHLRGTVTHIFVAERLGVELSLLVSVAIGGRPHISPMPGERSTSSPPRGSYRF